MKIEEAIAEKVQGIEKHHSSCMVGHLGIELLEISRDRLHGKMPVDNRTKQPFGILHGGASVAFAETLASIGAWVNCTEENQRAVGLEINANHLRPVTEGFVFGTAEPIHRGRKTQVWAIEIRDERDKLVCSSRCTLAVVEG